MMSRIFDREGCWVIFLGPLERSVEDYWPEAEAVEKRISPLRCSGKTVSSFGRNDDFFVFEKEQATAKTKCGGFFAALRMTARTYNCKDNSNSRGHGVVVEWGLHPTHRQSARWMGHPCVCGTSGRRATAI